MKMLSIAVILAGMMSFFAAGCSNENVSGNSGSVEREGVIPPIPEVSGGGFENPVVAEIIRLLPNIPLTERYLGEFIDTFAKAMGEFTPEERGVRNAGGFSNIKHDTIINGGISGRITITEELYFAWRGNDSGYTTATYQHRYFDYSHIEFLFLGGAVGVLKRWGDDHNKGGITHFTETYRGTINFRGQWQGRVVFDNLVYSIKTKGEEIIESRITSGKFFVEGLDDTGGVVFRKDLEDELVHKFCYQYKSSRFGSGKDTTGGGGKDTTGTGRDTIIIGGGGLTKGGDMENSAVTLENLNDFIRVYLSATTSSAMFNMANRRNNRSLPEEYYKGTDLWKGSGVTIGDISGRVEWVYEEVCNYEETANRYSENCNSTGTNKIFDFSNSNNLFLGGALGWSWQSSSNDDVLRINGAIAFQGRYRGRVVFDNIVYSEDRGRITSGSFYVESGGRNIHLSADLLYDFGWFSGEDRLDDIQLDVMPAVPVVSNGRLTDRGGDVVNADNVNTFFAVALSELNDWQYGSIRKKRGFLQQTAQEWLTHGRRSGYAIEKASYSFKENNSGRYSEVGTYSSEYFDYSNIGNLHFGGGYGMAFIYNDNDAEYHLNGIVNFSGSFRGALDFRNFRYRDRWGTYTVLGGNVMIGSLDVTDLYVEYVLRGGTIIVGDSINLLTGAWIHGIESAWFPVYFGQEGANDFDEPAELELASVWVHSIANQNISWEMMTKNHVQYPEWHPCWLPSGAPYWGEWHGYYSYASMNVFFAGQTVGYYLTEDFEITVSWESDEDLRLVLGDTHEFYEQHCYTGRNRTSESEGAGYRVTLPAGMHTQTFRMSDFRQPSTSAPDWFDPRYIYPLDVRKVSMLSFSAIAPSGQIQPPNTTVKTTNVRLTRLEVKGVEWRGWE